MKLCTYEEWNKTQQNSNFSEIFFTIVVFALLGFVIVVSNSMVIIDVVMKKRLRATTKTLTLSLAIADLMIGIAIFPFSAINKILEGYWIFGDLWCITNITLDMWLCTTSIYSIIAISIDRLIAITKPLHHSMLVTHDRTYMVVVAIWTGSFLLCIPSFLLANSSKSVNHQCRCIPVYAGRIYIIISALLNFYVPMVLVIFISTKIYINIRRAVTRTPLSDPIISSHTDGSKKKLYYNHKVSRGNVQISIENVRNTNEKNETVQLKAINRTYCTDPNIHSAEREILQFQPHSLKQTTNEQWDTRPKTGSMER
ncbi:7 transmembrane receptor (rhodopsin family) protein [Acanthocheilonema viteae]